MEEERWREGGEEEEGKDDERESESGSTTGRSTGCSSLGMRCREQGLDGNSFGSPFNPIHSL